MSVHWRSMAQGEVPLAVRPSGVAGTVVTEGANRKLATVGAVAVMERAVSADPATPIGWQAYVSAGSDEEK